MFSQWDPRLEIDVYRDEYEQFRRDVHILIMGTLNAATKYLDSTARQDLSQIENLMEKARGDYHQHLVEEHVDVMAQNANQETFLRNMALVALASRLTHSLRTMGRSAESFSPRKKRYGNTSMSEFDRLWVEYEERFGIDFQANTGRIAFVEPMREVRNQIVHEGSEANSFLPIGEMDLQGGDAGYLDMWFSKKYPQYTSGQGMGAEVSVSQELLDKDVKSAIDLVGWLAGELRKRELASITPTADTQ
jgi:hypothetical protein